LGFREVFTVIKERELYDFTFQDTRIEALIDYLPILEQYFIEVEILAESINNVETAKEILFQFLEDFGIKKEESIRTSYLELLMNKLKKE
jgi:adenylate cyclase class 2